MISGRARLAVCAAAASIMAACSLLPLTNSSTWILQAFFLVIVQSSAGALARRVPLARPLTILAQAVVSLLLLTLFFARRQAYLGVMPGPGVFRHFGSLLTAGVQDVSQFAIPAPVTSGIRLLLVAGVLLIALLVDALAVTYGSAAPAGLLLLALYSIAAGLSAGGSRWLWFVIAAAGYLLLLLAEGRDRLSRWGRVFGGPAGSAGAAAGFPDSSGISRGGGAATAPVRTGRRIGAMAMGIALIAPAALPSLGGGLLGVTGAGAGSGRGGSILAVNPLVALTDNLNQPDNRQVLIYRTNAKNTSDLYLRIVSLDEFNGEQWQSAKRTLSDVPERLPAVQGLTSQIKTTQIQTNIAAAKDYGQLWLPMPYPADQVRVDGRWRYEQVGRTVIGDRGQTTAGVSYSVDSLQVEPTAAQLEAAPAASANLVREYTTVPNSLPDVVRTTAQRIAKDATTEYQEAVALQNYFTSGEFTYSTSVSSGTGVDAIAKFLKNKEGFCVHFAFTMAAMARTLGIPARVAVGFTPAPRSPTAATRWASRTPTRGPSCTSRGSAGPASSPPRPGARCPATPRTPRRRTPAAPRPTCRRGAAARHPARVRAPRRPAPPRPSSWATATPSPRPRAAARRTAACGPRSAA